MPRIGFGPLALFVAVAACGATPAPVPAPTPPRVTPVMAPPPQLDPPAAPGLRLDGKVKPTRYAVELTVDPGRETFDGVATIALEVGEDIGGLWMHGADLTIGTAVLQQNGQRIATTVLPATPGTTDAEVIGFRFDGIVRKGPAELIVTYRGKIYSKELDGIHRQQERGEWYVFTQFEATDARRAFPCFDEPSYKVPFGLTLHVKKAHVAVSNAPMVSETDAANGMKTVKFAETKPLPTYLIALAVGPFDIVDGGKGGKNNTPLRIIVPKGRGGDAAFATKATPEVLALLEDYFGIPYPYEKLDQIAVPRKGGAMENPGLITYGLGLLIWPAEEETINRKKRFVGIGAHELAHQWFGNLVTLAWWDDTWLNESFASWMADATEIKYQPAWGGDVFLASRRSGVMKGDTLKTTRKIRQPIESKHDIANAFDGITYGKGASVLVMIEAWMGHDKFQQAVRKYLAAHAHKTATTADFLAALSAEGGPEVGPVMSSFLDQTGVPLVTVELSCKDTPKLLLAQQRYTTIGSSLPTAQTWHVPVCVEFGATKPEGRACTVLSQATGELALPTKTCPKWVLANDGELGYYRVAYKGDLLDKLLAIAPKQLTLPERIGVYGDMSALVDADRLPIKKLLELVAPLAKEDNRHLLSVASSFAGYLSSELVPKKLRPNRARLIRKLFGERARKLGWASTKGEADDVRLTRTSMLSWVAHTGEDPKLIAEAKKLADKWLADRKSLDPDVVGLVLGIAARFGDRAFFDKLYAAAKVEKERKERGQLLGAMGDFRDPEIVKKAMAIALTDEFASYESIGLVWSALNEDTRELAYEFIKTHHDALIAKLPRDYSFHGVAGSFCDAAHRADAEAFFKDKVAKVPGGPRGFAATLERVDLCIARKAAHGPGIEAFLAKY
jgi:alanyl aminopeptidase